MDIQLTDLQLSLIESIAKQEGFEDFQLKTTAGSAKGDNYLGVITRVIVEDGERILDLILKSSNDHTEFRKRMPARNVFLREIFVYKTIFPNIQEFQEEQGLSKGFSGYAKLYGSSDNDPDEFLILENLKEVGYSMWNRKIPMDKDHIESVLKEYGKFHATSLAIRKERPDMYAKLTKDLNPIFDVAEINKVTGNALNAFVTNAIKTVQGHQIATEALEKFSLEVDKYFLNEFRAEEQKLVVLHGDCWCNNIMFKYEDPDQKGPTKVCLIDWQLSNHGSPAKDLTYFLFTCAPKEILVDYRRYLKIYHDTVCECLTRLDCDPETVFPFDLLEYHWRKHTKFGIFMALMTLKLMLSESSEVPDLVEAAGSGKDFLKEMSFESINNDVYRQRIIDLLMVAVQYSWLE